MTKTLLEMKQPEENKIGLHRGRLIYAKRMNAHLCCGLVVSPDVGDLWWMSSPGGRSSVATKAEARLGCSGAVQCRFLLWIGWLVAIWCWVFDYGGLGWLEMKSL